MAVLAKRQQQLYQHAHVNLARVTRSFCQNCCKQNQPITDVRSHKNIIWKNNTSTIVFFVWSAATPLLTAIRNWITIPTWFCASVGVWHSTWSYCQFVDGSSEEAGGFASASLQESSWFGRSFEMAKQQEEKQWSEEGSWQNNKHLHHAVQNIHKVNACAQIVVFSSGLLRSTYHCSQVK